MSLASLTTSQSMNTESKQQTVENPTSSMTASESLLYPLSLDILRLCSFQSSV